MKEYYDNRAKKAGDAISAAGQWFPKEYTPQMCEEICKKIKISKKHKIIELGSGSDVLGSYIRKKCQFYLGLDISRSMLKKCFEDCNERENPNVIQSVTHALPVVDNFFDIVIINAVTMYIHDEYLFKKTLEEMIRIAIPNGLIFIGENNTPSRTYWDYSWFQNLNPLMRIIAKPYIKLRIWLVKKNIFSGKWKTHYAQVSPKLIKSIFKEHGIVTESDAACYTIRKKFFGKNPKGNRRIDFLINLKKSE